MKGFAKTLIRPDADLRYFVLGNPNAEQAIVFVNGLFHGLEGWKRAVGPKLQERFRLIFADYRGVGGSVRKNAAAFGLDQVVSDFLAIMDAEGIGAASFVGNSIGGKVCLRLAVKAPERVRSLTLLATSGSSRPHEGTMLSSFLKILDESASLADALIGLYPQFFSPSYYEKFVSMQNMLVANCVKYVQDRSHVAAFLEGMRDEEAAISCRLDSVVQPVFLISGDSDAVFPLADQSALTLTLPNCCQMVLSDCGHSVIAEKSEAVKIHMEQFLLGMEAQRCQNC